MGYVAGGMLNRARRRRAHTRSFASLQLRQRHRVDHGTRVDHRRIIIRLEPAREGRRPSRGPSPARPRTSCSPPRAPRPTYTKARPSSAPRAWGRRSQAAVSQDRASPNAVRQSRWPWRLYRSSDGTASGVTYDKIALVGDAKVTCACESPRSPGRGRRPASWAPCLYTSSRPRGRGGRALARGSRVVARDCAHGQLLPAANFGAQSAWLFNGASLARSS